MCVIRVGEDPLPPASRQKLRRMKAALDVEFRELIRQGIAEGSIVDCDPKLAAFTFAGALSWIGRWYRPDGGLAPAEIAEQCIRVLIDGLRAPAGRRRAPAGHAPRRAARPEPASPPPSDENRAMPATESAPAEPVLLRRDGAVAILQLNRPAAYNALDVPTARPSSPPASAWPRPATCAPSSSRGAGRSFGVGGDLRGDARRCRRRRRAADRFAPRRGADPRRRSTRR